MLGVHKGLKVDAKQFACAHASLILAYNIPTLARHCLNLGKGVLMKKVLIISFTIWFSSSLLANDSKVDLNAFAKLYFDKMVATQRPAATKKEVEEYLALLTDDVGHSHLPWDTDDSRLPSGKADKRKGMTFYLGAHTEYKAELLDVFTFNQSAVAIRYKNYAKGIHPQNNQPVEYSQTMMEVLEIENGKVAVIRKYHE
jgi:hypothetical protein